MKVISEPRKEPTLNINDYSEEQLADYYILVRCTDCIEKEYGILVHYPSKGYNFKFASCKEKGYYGFRSTIKESINAALEYNNTLIVASKSLPEAIAELFPS